MQTPASFPAPDLAEGLLEAWRTNNRITLFLLKKISDEGMAATLSKRGGRTVARQFGHLHSNRVYHFEHWARDLAAGMAKFEGKTDPTREELRAAFEASGMAMEEFIRRAIAGGNRGGFRKGIVVAVSYLISHESHHRGSILLTLKECGHKIDQEDAYAIWDWDRR